MRLSLILGVMFALCAADTGWSTPSQSTPFVSNNPELERVLALQHQITLLKTLIDREQQANNLIQAGKEIGLSSPQVAKPNQATCAAVPANIPCAQAYPDLYPQFDSGALTPNFSTPDLPPKNTKRTAPDKKPVAAKIPDLYWLDIRCLGTQCSALISSDAGNPTLFQRIQAGDTVSGHRIEHISASGVTSAYKGQPYEVLPAPRR